MSNRVGAGSRNSSDLRQLFRDNCSVYFDEDVEYEAANDAPQHTDKTSLPAQKKQNSTLIAPRTSQQNTSTLPLSRGINTSNRNSSQLTCRAGLPPLLPEPNVTALKNAETLRGWPVSYRSPSPIHAAARQWGDKTIGEGWTLQRIRTDGRDRLEKDRERDGGRKGLR